MVKSEMCVCRLCLFKGNQKHFQSVFQTPSKDTVHYMQKYLSIDVQKDDTLPTHLCLKCLHQLNQWNIFYNSCQSTQRMLKRLHSPDLKKNNIIDTVNDILKGINGEDDVDVITVEDSSFTLGPTISSSVDLEDKSTNVSNEAQLAISKLDESHNIYQCQICPNSFSDCLQYLDHLDSHDGENVFSCDNCEKVFNSRIDLADHEKNHRSNCSICRKSLRKSSMKLHLIKHDGRFICNECKHTFSTNAALEQHIKSVHGNLKSHVCEMCGKSLSSMSSLNVHLKSHGDERTFKCKECNYAGRTSAALYVHKLKHSSEIVSCKLCSKKFKNVRLLNAHIQRVHQAKEKKHKCQHCAKVFLDKHRLTIHLRGHLGIKPFKCNLCDKGFARSDGLSEHIQTHLKREESECSKCGKSFVTQRGFKRHQCSQ